MTLLWSGYQFRPWDGYGRFGTYMVKALLKMGIDVKPILEEEANMPNWMQEMRGASFDASIVISCLPPYFLQRMPCRHWLFTMTEGDGLPDGWLKSIEWAGVERIIVPCEHNAKAFRDGGVQIPIHVIPGGTEPDDFPVQSIEHREGKVYTFLTLADRGQRKGWGEVWTAFFKAFGSFGDTWNVRLLVKCRPNGNDLIDMIRNADSLDPRITFLVDDAQDIAQVYSLADCLALPSRSEGFGMPHREGAMAGLPVITQRHSGMDDGHTDEWAIVVEKGQMQPIPSHDKHIKGQWRVADTDELAAKMRWCYENPNEACQQGLKAAMWLRKHQTWDHSASALLQLLQQEGVVERELEYA